MIDEAFDEFFTANKAYADAFTLQGLSPRPARHLAVVSCMDSRIQPLEALGLVPGDAKILRNAGGRVTPDVLRSLAVAVALLGVDRIAVMHHTRCAMTEVTDDAVRGAVRAAGAPGIETQEYFTVADRDLALRQDVEAVRSSPLIPPDVAVTGWRYDVDTGRIHTVVP